MSYEGKTIMGTIKGRKNYEFRLKMMIAYNKVMAMRKRKT